jgi:hypothetical protein
MALDTEVYTLPTFWAVALFNDDTSHFDDTDQAHFNAFCADMDRRYLLWHCADMADDTGFMRYHDAAHYGVLACDVAEYAFTVYHAETA